MQTHISRMCYFFTTDDMANKRKKYGTTSDKVKITKKKRCVLLADIDVW